ncbi:MAG TPA: SpoIIE family protein phosphatase [Acidobacteriaceae bacterium]|nr:SpoIIE family protein phosphatase [Acidobacteriaceae bacterium]
MRRVILAICLFVLAAGAVRSPAQVFDLDHGRASVAPLDGLWRFHPGDDPRWADAGFDDSQWPLLQSDKPWSGQGYKNLSGVGWYRFRLTLPAGGEAFALYLPKIRNCYQVFADGVLLTTVGKMPPNPVAYSTTPTVVTLPAAGHPVTLAVRVWREPRFGAGGGPDGTTLFGTKGAIEERAEADLSAAEWTESENFDLGCLFLLGAAITFTLYLMRPLDREFLWAGIYTAARGLDSLMVWWGDTHTFAITAFRLIMPVISMVVLGALICVFGTLFRAPRDLYLRVSVFSYGIFCVATVLFNLWLLPSSSYLPAVVVSLVGIYLWIGINLLRRSREGDMDARVIAFPVLFGIAIDLFDVVVATVSSSGKQLSPAWSFATRTPFPVHYDSLTGIVTVFVVLAVLINRLTRSRRKEERYAAEMEAARVVQQVLLPEPNATVEGFGVVAEYLPAAEVGGDFYQILPTRDGGLLLVTGDVSGKGMPAAMLVALLVGAIRTEAAHTSDPAVLLETLNTRVHGRMSDGFATCAALHIAADGSAVLSNAANPAPYLNGEEIALVGALPLGMMAEVQYDNHRFTLQSGDILTFVSDGVIEATKSDTGELFGFDRTRTLSLLPALEIAETARTFGQTDDITVLTLQYLPV